MAVFLSRKKQILAGLAASPCENGEAWPAPGDCNPDDVVARPLPTPRSEVRPLFSGGGTESPLQEPGCKPDKSLKGCIDRDLIAVCGLINTSPAFVTTSSCSGRLTVFQQGDRRSGSNTKKGGKIVYASHSTVDVSEAARTIVDRIKSGRPHYQVRKDLALTTPGGDASRDERSHLSLSVPAVPPARQVLPAPRALVDQPLIDLKFEPFVIHVECVDLSSARALLAAALTSGLKHSGISSAGPKRYIVALRGSQRLEVPIAVPSGSPSIRTAESAATIAADAAVVSTVLLVTPEYLELLLQVCNAKLQLNLEQISRLHEALRKLADECGPEAEPNGRAKGAERVGVISLVKNRRHRRKTTKTTKPGLIDDSSASEVAAPLADSLHFGPASSASPVCSTDPSRSHPGAERSSCVSVSCRQLGVSGLLDRRQLHLWGCACALEYPHLCVFGGFSRSRRSDSLLVYNLETSRWDERRACSPPDGPGSRVWSSLLSLGAGFLLLLFGRRGPGDACSDCWVVDTTTWRWIPVLFSDTHLGLCSDDQEKRSSRTSSPCNGDALRHGELGGHGFSGEGTISWQSSMSSMGCTAGSSLSSSAAEKSFHAPELNTRPKGRWRHAACVESTSWTNVANGLRGLAHVWVYGGVNGAQPISDYILGDLWRLTLTVDVPKGSSRPLRAVGRWTLIPRQGDDAPPSLHSLSMVSSSTHLYLFGGVSQNDATSGDPVSLQVLYTFELASATWRRVVTAPDGTPSKSTLDVSGFSGAAARGGNVKETCGVLPSPRFSHISLFMPGADKREPVAEMTPAGHASRGYVVVVGGCDGSRAANDIWRLELDSMSWKFVGDLPNAESSWRCRFGGAVSHRDEKLYLVGGGGICFTFGSHADPPICISLAPSISKDEKETSVLSALTDRGGGCCDFSAPMSSQEGIQDAREQQALFDGNQVLLDTPAAEQRTHKGKKSMRSQRRQSGARTWLIVGDTAYVKLLKSALERLDIYDFSRKITCLSSDAVPRQKAIAAAAGPPGTALTSKQIDIVPSTVMAIPVKHSFDLEEVLGGILRKGAVEEITGRNGCLSDRVWFQEYSGDEDWRRPSSAVDRALAESILAASRKFGIGGSFFSRMVLAPEREHEDKPTSVCDQQTYEDAIIAQLKLPRKFERLGGVLLLPSGGLDGLRAYSERIADGEAPGAFEKAVWASFAEKTKAEAIGVQARIVGPERRSQVELLYGLSGLVNHLENGVVYHFDVTKCMFASGNGTERARFANLINTSSLPTPEVVVDLFCGIGYFTLAALVHVAADKLCHIYACDWNAEALKFLDTALSMNHVDRGRVTLFLCDSFQTVQGSISTPSFSYSGQASEPLKPPPACLLGKADRVSLGLLPSSKKAWGTALSVLNKTTGGMLHVHGIGFLEFVEEPAEAIEVRWDRGSWRLGNQVRRFPKRHDPRSPTDGGQPAHRKSSRCADPKPKYAIVRGKKLYLGRDVGMDLVFAQQVLRDLSEIFVAQQNASRRVESCCWMLRISHVERVKSYAPKVHHFVVDISCCPALVGASDRKQ